MTIPPPGFDTFLTDGHRGPMRRILPLLFLLTLQAHAVKDVLIVGDSLTCGAFGASLAKLVNQGGARSYKLFCAVSSSASSWITSANPPGQICQTSSDENPKLTPCGGDGKIPAWSTVLSFAGPHVIIALGTNSLESSVPGDPYQRLIASVPRTSQLTWIGPPHLRADQARGFSPARLRMLEGNLDGFYANLLKMLPANSLIDSRPFTVRGIPGGETIDGVHRGDRGGADWAQRLYRTLEAMIR